MNKPLLAITMGDPSGIGPETIVGAWARAELHDVCRAVVLGHPEVLRRAVKLLGLDAQVVEITTPEEASSTPDTIPCLMCVADDAQFVPPAAIDPRGGQAAYDALAYAAELALAGRVDGITTGPLHKTALRRAGHRWPGHTELLAHFCGVEDVAMMLHLQPSVAIRGRAGLSVVHATLHTALRDVFDELTSQRIQSRIQLADQAVRDLLGPAQQQTPPKIAVAALNPHAGEEGLFGDEELTTIAPAVAACQEQGIDVSGPLSTDTLFRRAAEGEFDVVVAMYHDQGHIALKLLDMHRAVNVTLGLPVVRTSVAHGTAFDLAWQGRAETTGMVEAIQVATQLIAHRRETVASPDTASTT
jgi:4-hydroxythreonine-4-phosphate dehydrogenase